MAPSGSRMPAPRRTTPASTVAAAATATATTSQVDHVRPSLPVSGIAATKSAASAMPPRDGAPGPGEPVDPPVVQDREGSGEDGAGAEQHDDRGPVLGVPQGLHEPPGDAGDDTDEEGQVGPRQVGVDERADGPEADESRLVRRDLQRLGGLEDDGAGTECGEESCGADQGRRGVARRERLTADEEGQPQGRHSREACQGRELVEVGGDQPDQPDADEAAAEVEQDPPHADAGVGARSGSAPRCARPAPRR